MNARGFTLIEVMIVVSIIGILAAIALPSYRNIIMSSHRSDAHVALSEIQIRQNKLRANCRYYGTISTTTVCGANTGATTFAYNTESPEGYYDLVVTSNTSQGYTATATAKDGQADDTDCTNITLTVSASDPDGTQGGTSGADCW